MRLLLLASLLAITAACSPPAETKTEAPPAVEAPGVPAADLGPYTNTWDSDQFSSFRHTLNAATPGSHALTLTALTNSPGGETIAVYPIGADDQRSTVRIIFVIADVDGTTGAENVDIPAEGLPVEVVIENASGRRHAGNYTISIAP